MTKIGIHPTVSIVAHPDFTHMLQPARSQIRERTVRGTN